MRIPGEKQMHPLGCLGQACTACGPRSRGVTEATAAPLVSQATLQQGKQQQHFRVAAAPAGIPAPSIGAEEWPSGFPCAPGWADRGPRVRFCMRRNVQGTLPCKTSKAFLRRPQFLANAKIPAAAPHPAPSPSSSRIVQLPSDHQSQEPTGPELPPPPLSAAAGRDGKAIGHPSELLPCLHG